MRFSCPTCNQAMETADSAAGQQVACPTCGQRLQVPSPGPPPTPINKTLLGNLEIGPAPQQRVQSAPPPGPGAPPPGPPPMPGPAPRGRPVEMDDDWERAPRGR